MAYSGLTTIRQVIYESNINKFLNTSAVKYIISPTKIDDIEDLSEEFVVLPPREDLPKYYVYTNLESLNRFRFVSDYLAS